MTPDVQRNVLRNTFGRRAVVSLMVAAVLAVCLYVQDIAADTRRVLIVGDSLAAQSYYKRGLQRVLDESGLGAVSVEGASTAIGGMKASYFASNYVLPGSDQGLLDRIDLMLAAFPTIEIVEIWLGCNDILWESWNTSYTSQQEADLLASIQTDLQTVVDHIIGLRRNLRVVFCDHDYFNCVETVTPGRPEYSLFNETNWRYWGSPTPMRLNGMLVGLGQKKQAIADATPRCTYVQNIGRMQHYFGYRPQLEIGQAPLPGGDPTLPSPPEAMGDDEVHGGKDYLHFSVKGFMHLGRDCLNAYYRPWLETSAWPFATDPEPINGIRHVPLNAVLKWRSGAAALSHNVYFCSAGGTFECVSEKQSATTYSPESLAYDTTYYWRIDENFSGHVETGDFWLFVTESLAASEPTPADGQTDTSVLTKLSWRAGANTPLHDVYLGTSPGSLAKVASGQVPVFFDPGQLQFDATYHWRVDEVRGGVITQGPVWSFTTQPPAAIAPIPPDGERYADVHSVLQWFVPEGASSHDIYFGASLGGLQMVAQGQTAASFNPGTLDNNTSYIWRIDENMPSGKITGKVWIFTTGTQYLVVTHPSPVDGETQASTHTFLRWFAGEGAVAHNVYLGESPGALEQVSSQQTTLKYDPGALAYGKTYYWRVDEVYGKSVETGAGYSFTTAFREATEPDPADALTRVDQPVRLRWQAGADATSHDIYLGVAPGSLNLLASGHAYPWIDPATLATNTTYYWRVDEVSATGTAQGVLWSFETRKDFLVIMKQPVGGTVVAGMPHPFSVQTSGGYPPLSYEWRKDGVMTPRASDAATYPLTFATPGDAGRWSVMVSDANVDVQVSNDAELSVIGTLPVIGPFGTANLTCLLIVLGIRKSKRQ